MSKVSAYRRELNVGETVYVDYPASPWHYLVGKVIGIASGARYKVEFCDRGSDTVRKTSSAWFSLDRLVLGGELAPDLSQTAARTVGKAIDQMIHKGELVKPPQPEPTLTVAVEPEPVIKDSLTTEEIADTYERVQQIVVVTDESGDEALYLDGVLKAWDSTIYACDIAAIAGDAVVTVCHTNAGRTLLDWPKKLSDVFASNSPEIPDSSNPSETPNSSPDIGELERCEANEAPEPRKRVLYIAGPMRGIAWFNYPLFDRVAKELRDAGNEVISPADEDRMHDGFDPYANPSHANPDACTFPKTMDFAKTVRRCLEAVLRCDEIVLLPGWENSNGAVAELTLAMWLNKRVRHLNIDDENRFTYACYWTSLISLAVQLSEHHMPEVERMGLAEQDDEDILAEASRITRGSRQAQYGPPDQDFRRTAGMWSALFLSKLKDGVTFEPRDVALAMILLKTSRETHQRKRDNWVDIAGYASCGSRCN